MGRIALVVPESTTNLVSNPSVELATTGYTAIGAATALARSITYQQRGAYSLSVTPDTGNNDGVYYAVTLTAATQYTVSVDVKGVNAIPYRIHIYDVTAVGYLAGATPTQFTGDGEWHRQTMTFTTSGNTSFRIQIEKDTSASVAAFYVDGLQCEQKGYDTTYCDGEQPGCEWNGAKHASTSDRDAQSRAGGRVIDIDDTYNVVTTLMSGMGLPPNKHNVQGLALQPGALLQSVKTLPRTIILRCETDTASETAMHTARKNLINALKTDRVATLQPVLLRYTNGAGDTLEIPCTYDTGLEGSDWSHLIHDTFVLRLIAYDPFWREVGESAAALDSSDSATVRYIAGRVDGLWDALGPPSAAFPVYALAIAEDGTVYIGGAFTNWDGIANADYIVKWDPQTGTYSALGTGMDGDVNALAIGPDGTLYAGGAFANAGGGAASKVAAWDGSAWSALGAGCDNTVSALAVGLDGKLYAGGIFLNAGGAGANRIASWDGAAWAALGTGLNSSCNEIGVMPDGTIIAGGAFTTAGGGAAKQMATWDGTTWAAMGSGLDNTGNCLALAISPAGIVYVGGNFTTAGGVAAVGLAQWNGSSWSPLGSGLASGAVYALTVAEDGSVYAGGDFVLADLTIADRVARWNGFAWSHLDIDLPGSPITQALRARGDDLYIGFSTTGTATFAGAATITNGGMVRAYPRILVKRSGGTSAKLQRIANETTGQELLFDLDLLDGEIITIDLSTGQKSISSNYRGTSLGNGRLLAGSDFATFGLLPGANQVTCFVSTAGGATIEANCIWRPAHWSVDGAA